MWVWVLACKSPASLQGKGGHLQGRAFPCCLCKPQIQKRMVTGSTLVYPPVWGADRANGFLLVELFLVDQERRRGEERYWVFWRDHPFRVSKEIIHVPCPQCDYKMTDQVVTGVGFAKETFIWKLEGVPSHLHGYQVMIRSLMFFASVGQSELDLSHTVNICIKKGIWKLGLDASGC